MEIHPKNIFDILYERSLEEINAFEANEDELEDSILILHELEYKLNKLSKNYHSINPKLLKNITLHFLEKANESWDAVYGPLVWGFQNWLSKHPIHDPEGWANMIINYSTEESGLTDEEFVQSVLKDGLSWGGSQGKWNQIGPKDVFKCLSTDRIKREIADGFSYDPDSIESYASVDDIKELMKNHGWKARQFTDFEKVNGGEFEDYLTYVKEHDLLDELGEVVLKNMDVTDYISSDVEAYSGYVDLDAVNCAIQKFLYPQYMNMFGPQIKKISHQCNEAIKRLRDVNHIQSTTYEKLFTDIKHNFDNEQQLSTDIRKAYQLISQMTVAISLALNVNHVNGNIMQDYSEHDLSSTFMDELHDLDTSVWDNELRSMVGRLPNK